VLTIDRTSYYKTIAWNWDWLSRRK
jgi:hypothetical protein